MSRKEWREVLGQCLVFVILLAGIALLIGGIDLVQGLPFESEKFVIMLSLWLLSGSLFLGLSPFALDGKQRGLEYLLTLPLSRRRLLLIKFLPRLAVIVIFYLAFAFLYGLIGNDALGGSYTLFSLAYFALFFISFSLSVVHENFIVQFIWAGIAMAGYLPLCLFIVMRGFAWKFKVPVSWVGFGIWHDLTYDLPTLAVSIAVFILMAVPFVASLFMAFAKFDLKPARAFNRRQLLVFAPLLLAAFAISLGLTYFVQGRSAHWDSQFTILKDRRLLEAGFPGKLDVHDANGRHRTDTRLAAFWDRRPLLADRDHVYLHGYDTKDGSQFIGSLNLADLSWKELHRSPHGYAVSSDSQEFYYDGECFVYLRRTRVGAGRPGRDYAQAAGGDILELVRVDPASGKSRTNAFRHPQFRRQQKSFFIGGDEREGLHFWLIVRQWQNVLRLWEDGRVEDLGASKGLAIYAGGMLFTRGDGSLRIRRLLAAGSEAVKEIAGSFSLINHPSFFAIENARPDEIYAVRDKRIVCIDLATLAVDDVAPARGHIWMLPSGDFYFVEFQSWPALPSDQWKKLYRLKDGKLVLLKRFDFADAGYGNIRIDAHGVILTQWRKENKNEMSGTMRFFAFPDLKELRFKKLD
jgi:hypothetical protein